METMDHTERKAPRGMGRGWRGERGSQLVEFALVAPLFLVLTMMALDGGRLLATYTVLKSAAREAALYGAKYPASTNGTLQTIALQEGASMLQSAKLTTVASSSSWSYGTGTSTGTQSEETVQLSYQFDFTTPVLSVANPLTITAKHSALVQ